MWNQPAWRHNPLLERPLEPMYIVTSYGPNMGQHLQRLEVMIYRFPALRPVVFRNIQ